MTMLMPPQNVPSASRVSSSPSSPRTRSFTHLLANPFWQNEQTKALETLQNTVSSFRLPGLIQSFSYLCFAVMCLSRCSCLVYNDEHSCRRGENQSPA